MHYISLMNRMIFSIILYATPSLAMLEFEGKVRELLMAEGCEDSEISRVG